MKTPTTRQDLKTTGAAVRITIQRGETGDKVPGFDPAAAPLETDAEAGGGPVPAAGEDMPPRKPAGGSNASGHASGLRRWRQVGQKRADDGALKEGHAYLIWWLLILAFVGIGYVAVLWV